MKHLAHSYDKRDLRRFVRGLALLFAALLFSGCYIIAQETTCKFKFKKKYNCPFKEISMIEDEVSLGNQIKLKGCGKIVTYNGTKEILVEE